MPVFKLKISDTITYHRYKLVNIDADTLEEAKKVALNAALAGDFRSEVWVDERIDNIPYEVEEING